MRNRLTRTLLQVGLMVLTMKRVVECSEMTKDKHQLDNTSCISNTGICSGSANFTANSNVPSSNCTVLNCVCELNKIYVRKCCSRDEVERVMRCVSSNESAPSHFWNTISCGAFQARHMHVKCRDAKSLHLIRHEYYGPQLVENGSLVYGNLSISEYCVEYIQNETIVRSMVCWNHSKSNEEEGHITVSYGILICPTIFLILTFLVYGLVPILKVEGQNLLCYIVSMLVRNLALCAVSSIVEPSHFVRVILAFLVYFSLLASFFWLNVICLDLWSALAGCRLVNTFLETLDSKKFLAYSLYAWGCSTLIVTATFSLEYYHSSSTDFIRLGFATDAEFACFYSFISVTIISNLCMFIYTAYIIKRHTTEVVTRELFWDTALSFHDEYGFNVYVMLFTVMGVKWITDVISFYYPALPMLRLITCAVNASDGVFIFLILVCNRKTRKCLRKTLAWCYLSMKR